MTLDDREALGRLIIIAHVQAERLAALEADVAKLKAAQSAAAGERVCVVCGEVLRALADEGRVRRWRDPENAQQWLYAGLESLEVAA